MVAQNLGLAGVENSFGSAADLVPWYGIAIVAYAGLCAVGVALQAVPLFRDKLPYRWMAACCIVLMFVGAFAVRVAFYSLHMTTGF